MISPHLRFEGFDARSWTNFLSLFAPGVRDRVEGDAADTDVPELDLREARGEVVEGTLIIVRADDGRVLRAFHTTRGRVRDLAYDGPQDLERVARAYAARRAFELREGVLDELVETVAQRLERSDDYATQFLVLARVLRELTQAGKIHTWPRPVEDVPIPTSGMVRRALDIVLPDEHALVLALWENGEPWTAVALRRRDGAIDLAAGPDLLFRWAGPLGGDWRRDHRIVADAVARAVAPVHLGIFAEASQIRALLRDADPGAWARAVAVRDIIVHPTPPYVAVALGADAARAVARTTSRWLGGFDALKPLAPFASYVRGRVGEVGSITALLGFDPLRALARSLAERPVRDPQPPAK
jgi:hypothetical protein